MGILIRRLLLLVESYSTKKTRARAVTHQDQFHTGLTGEAARWKVIGRDLEKKQLKIAEHGLELITQSYW